MSDDKKSPPPSPKGAKDTKPPEKRAAPDIKPDKITMVKAQASEDPPFGFSREVVTGKEE